MSNMDSQLRSQLVPGARVRVTQQIAARDHTWTTEVRGTVVDFGQRETGSWYAHSRDDKLWLDRRTIRRDDGELSTLILDDYSVVEVESGPAATGDADEKKNESN